MPSQTHLEQLINAELASLTQIRHDLHAHPQLAFDETYANNLVTSELTHLNIPHHSPIAQTGVVAWIDGDDKSQARALRADMDALPITEQTSAPYTSTNPGCMHACGHDGHTTILIGAARILAKLAATSPLPYPVKFLFQPAEEQEGGAELMIQHGALTEQFGDFQTKRIYGLHGWPGLKVGQLATKPGPLLASADTFQITVTGRGGHAAMPHTTADPITAAAHIVTALQTIVARNTDPTDPAVVTVGTFNAGSIENVIPQSATLTGTTRAITETTRDFLHQRVIEIAQHIAAAHNTSAQVDINRGYPVTLNNPEATDTVLNTARNLLGEHNVILAPNPSMGAEDFAYYSQQIPACFYLIGLCPPDQDTFPNLHTPQFDFNDDALKTGLTMMCHLALTPLN